MDRIKTFLIERTGTSRYCLRIFDSKGGNGCPGGHYHQAFSEPVGETQDDPKSKYLCTNPPEIPKDDPRWPAKCEKCDYQFKPEDVRQVWGDALYRRVDSGELKLLEDMPAGAVWCEEWYEDWMPGPDGQSWACKLPDGTDWNIDGRANNCTRPNEKHHCWVREGVAPDFNVGKGGNTCAAGAGSIATPGYHGFLRNGWLERC